MPAENKLARGFGIDITDGIAYIGGMAVINIRNLPDDIHLRLRVRAAKAGRSMEAEARDIITKACAAEASRPLPVDDLQDWVESLYRGRKPRAVVADLLEERRAEAATEAGSEAATEAGAERRRR